MTTCRTIVGLCVLCAFAVSAFGAQGAAAASKGTTAFTCKKTGPGGGFTKAHCKASDAGSGEYSHVAIAEGTTTELKGTNANSGSETAETPIVKLKNKISGFDYELQVEVAQGEGWATNAKDPVTGEHYVHGTATVSFTGATVTLPANKGCKVKEGKIETKPLLATTKGQGDFLKFEPAEGSVMAVYTVEGCSAAIVNGTWEVTGSIKCPVDGATVVCTHAETTEQGTLKGKGQQTGVEGVLTLSAKDPEAGDEDFTPLSVTTIETP